MTRRILVHLNIDVPDDDQREADEIGEAIVSAVHDVGSSRLSDATAVQWLVVCNALSEELEATS